MPIRSASHTSLRIGRLLSRIAPPTPRATAVPVPSDVPGDQGAQRRLGCEEGADPALKFAAGVADALARASPGVPRGRSPFSRVADVPPRGPRRLNHACAKNTRAPCGQKHEALVTARDFPKT